MKLLEVFKRNAYANDVGPGVYDIHSPRVPSVEELKNKIKEFIQAGIRKDRMVVNPDCGLKTRGWGETEESLKNMVEAAKVSFLTDPPRGLPPKLTKFCMLPQWAREAFA